MTPARAGTTAAWGTPRTATRDDPRAGGDDRASLDRWWIPPDDPRAGGDDASTPVVVVVDDIGLLPVAQDAAEGLYRLVDAAYEKRSIAISSNLHPAAFDELMPKTLAAVLLGWS